MNLIQCVSLVLSCLLILELEQCNSTSRESRQNQRRESDQRQHGSIISLFPDENQTPHLDELPDRGTNYKEGNRVRSIRATKPDIEYEDEEDYDEEKERLELMDQERRRRQTETGDSRNNGGGSTTTTPKKATRNDILLPEDYSVFEIPKDPDNNPMPLFIYINVINILSWDELNEMLHVDMELRVMWTDYRIMYFNNKSGLNTERGRPPIENLTKEEVRSKKKTLNNPYILDKIWKPNLFIENLLSIKQPTLMARPLTIKFIPEVGWFEYLTRISVKMDCEMDFHKYPADTQECKFAIRGFSYPKKDLNLNWYKNGVYLNDLTLPSFDVIIKSTGHHDIHLYKNQENDPDDVFEVLTFVIAARRKLSYHIVQTYLASTFYIVITTLCFLLPSRMIEARIGISMTTLLTLTAMFAAVRDSTPIASYVKAIDIWMVGCIFFVFLVLAQFTIHTWITGGKGDEEENSPSRKVSLREPQLDGKIDGACIGSGGEKEPMESPDAAGLKYQCPSSSTRPRPASRRALKWAHMSEAYSFPMFLTIFTVYTIIYWSWLLTSADYFNWKVNSTLNDVVDFSDD